jgi:hypothetical protein
MIGMSQMTDIPEDWLLLCGLAKVLGVGPDVAKKIADSGLVATRTFPGCHRRYSRASAEELALRCTSVPSQEQQPA